MLSVKELGYIGVQASDIPAWGTFAIDVLGLQKSDLAIPDGLGLRLDDSAYRILVEPGPADDLAFIGFDCDTDDTLDAIIGKLRAAGCAVEACDDEAAARRLVGRLYVTHDPAGNRVELYVDLARASAPFLSPLVGSGFFTANGGLGHVFLPAPDRQPMIDFYTCLGFRLSDFIVQEVAPGMVMDAAFMHCNGRHHTIAFAAFPSPKRLHHLMIETNSRFDVGRAHDRVLNARLPLEFTLGMHPNDQMFSFYVRTPSGFSLEFGADGRLILDDENWEVVTYDRLSVWGHQPPALVAAALT